MEDDVPWTRPAAHAVCIRGGEILLARLSPDMVQRGQWTLPGGGIDWGEDPADAVVRELHEETGLTGRVGDVLGVFSATFVRSAERQQHSLHFLSTVFEIHDVDGEPVHELEGSTDRAAWVSLDHLDEIEIVPLTEHAIGLWRRRRCSTTALTARALEIRRRYAAFETARFGREWTTTELLAGFMTDVGDLARLVLAHGGVREIDDVDTKLAHELADCLWSVLVLGERLGIDVGAAFASTMDHLERSLDDAT